MTRAYAGRMARRAEVIAKDPALRRTNPDQDVSPEALAAWFDRVQSGEPTDPGVSAAETLAEIREHGEE